MLSATRSYYRRSRFQTGIDWVIRQLNNCFCQSRRKRVPVLSWGRIRQLKERDCFCLSYALHMMQIHSSAKAGNSNALQELQIHSSAKSCKFIALPKLQIHISVKPTNSYALPKLQIHMLCQSCKFICSAKAANS